MFRRLQILCNCMARGWLHMPDVIVKDNEPVRHNSDIIVLNEIGVGQPRNGREGNSGWTVGVIASSAARECLIYLQPIVTL